MSDVFSDMQVAFRTGDGKAFSRLSSDLRVGLPAQEHLIVPAVEAWLNDGLLGNLAAVVCTEVGLCVRHSATFDQLVARLKDAIPQTEHLGTRFQLLRALTQLVPRMDFATLEVVTPLVATEITGPLREVGSALRLPSFLGASLPTSLHQPMLAFNAVVLSQFPLPPNLDDRSMAEFQPHMLELLALRQILSKVDRASREALAITFEQRFLPYGQSDGVQLGPLGPTHVNTILEWIAFMSSVIPFRHGHEFSALIGRGPKMPLFSRLAAGYQAEDRAQCLDLLRRTLSGVQQMHKENDRRNLYYVYRTLTQIAYAFFGQRDPEVRGLLSEILPFTGLPQLRWHVYTVIKSMPE